MAQKKNYWASTIAFLLLIVLPGGSYLYLKKGFSYRKQSLTEMTSIDSIDWSRHLIRHGQGREDSLQSKIVIAVSNTDKADLKLNAPIIQALHNQFGARQEVKFALFFKDSIGYVHFTDRDVLDDIFVITSYRDGALSVDKLTLVDQQGKVRGYYDMNDKVQMQKLVRHIAVLLPLEKKRKLDLIRKSD